MRILFCFLFVSSVYAASEKKGLKDLFRDPNPSFGTIHRSLMHNPELVKLLSEQTKETNQIVKPFAGDIHYELLKEKEKFKAIGLPVPIHETIIYDYTRLDGGNVSFWVYKDGKPVYTTKNPKTKKNIDNVKNIFRTIAASIILSRNVKKPDKATLLKVYDMTHKVMASRTQIFYPDALNFIAKRMRNGYGHAEVRVKYVLSRHEFHINQYAVEIKSISKFVVVFNDPDGNPYELDEPLYLESSLLLDLETMQFGKEVYTLHLGAVQGGYFAKFR